MAKKKPKHVVVARASLAPAPPKGPAPTPNPEPTAAPLPSLDALPELPPWPFFGLTPPAPSAPLAQPAATRDPTARIWFFGILLALSLTIAALFRGFLSDVLLALLATGVLRPLHRRFSSKALGAAICTALALGVVVGPLVYLAVSLSSEAATLIDAARGSLSLDRVNAALFGDGWFATKARELSRMVGYTYSPESVKAALGGAVSAIAKALYSQANALLSNVLVFLFHLFIFVVCLYYLLADGPEFGRAWRAISPLPEEEDDLLVDRFQSVGRAILWGNGVGSVVQGIVGGIAMAAVGLPSPILWATVMAFAAFLPMVGISIVTVPATIFLALEERYVAAGIFLAVTGVVSLLFENVVKTKMIGSSLRMHDAVILLSILAGMGVFGLLGVLYGPLVVALWIAAVELYQKKYRHASSPA